MKVTYSIRGNQVIFHGGLYSGEAYDEARLEKFIQNIRDRRSSYANDEAYQRHLGIYTSALAYLLSQTG